MFGEYKILKLQGFKKEGININGEYLCNFKNIYSKKIGIKNINNLIENSIKIFEKSVNETLTPNCKKGLIFGQVQSGKTSNFLSLISLVFDNGYDIVLIIGGFDKDLLFQNVSRIKEVFADKKNIEILDFNDLKTYTYDQIVDFLRENSNKKIIITSLKNKRHLKTISTYFEKSQYLQNLNILIIDDEGDQASLNSNENTSKKSPTVIYELITKLFYVLKNYSYISLTATPFANLLISKEDQIYLDFVILIYPGEKYMGLNEFHSDENSEKYLRIIDEIDVEDYRYPLSTFIMASTLKEIYTNDSNDISKMLIHTEWKVNSHSEIYKNLEYQISELKKLTKLKETNIEYEKFINFVNFGFQEFYKRIFDRKNESDRKILKLFISRLKNTDIIVRNSSIEFKDSRNKKSILKNIIYIGANLVERGVTFENLIVTYMVRRSKNRSNLDTILQRARWFGYRLDYSQFIRIFCTQRINDDFKELVDVHNDLWFDIISNPEETKNWICKIAVKDNKNLQPTRTGVAKLSYQSFQKWFTQTKFFETSDLEFEIIETQKDLASVMSYNGIEHKEIEYKNFDDFEKVYRNIISLIFQKCFKNENQKINYENFINNLKRENLPIKVIFMRNGKVSQRTERGNGKNDRISFFSGQRSTKINENEYKGDRYINRYKINKNCILIEVYNFEVLPSKSNLNKEIKDGIFYAIYIPGETKGYYINGNEF